jgi:hypothetical protein
MCLQVGMVTDHFMRIILKSIHFLGFFNVARPPLCRVSDLPDSVSYFFQPLQQRFIPGYHDVWIEGGIRPVLLLPRICDSDPMGLARGNVLRGVEIGL